MIKNEPLKKYAQELRKNATKEENTLWYRFLRHYPVQFRRQCVFEPYIVDFYCARALLVVELDGSHHYDPEEMKKDEIRTRYLESRGLKVLRFSNADVNAFFDRVCEVIDSCVKERYSEEPIPPGMGRKAFSTLQNQRGMSPHPPPSGAPSPPRGRYYIGR